MTLRSILLGTAAGSLVVTGAIAADLPAGQTEPADYVRVCDAHGSGYYELPGTDACVKLTGEVRGRYHFSKSGSDDAAGRFDGRGRFGVDGRRQTNFGTARAFIRAEGSFADKASVSFADAFGQLGGFVFGKASSFGNITYGAYAMNVNHSGHASNYHTDNSGAMLGYSLDVGFGTNISVGIEAPTGGAKLIPDIGAAIALNQGWGSITVGGGAISHLSEGTKYNTMHADYPTEATAIAALDDPADLTSFGFYAGGGAEIPIPGLSSTKIGASGFFFSGALSKMAAFSSIDVYARVPECTGAMCTQPTGAGRPLFKTDMEPATAAHVGNAGTADDPIYYATAAYLTSDDFDADTLQMQTLFDAESEGGVNYTVGQPDEPEMNMGHIQEIKQNSGFSANGGLSHSFSSDIALHVNGGFFSASEGDYGVSGFVAGGSFDYAPVPGTTFSLGGEFASRSVSFGGDDGPTKTAFEADSQSFDPSWGATLQVVQSF